MVFLFGFVVIGLMLVGLALTIALYLVLTGSNSGASNAASKAQSSFMNEGDFHSGPNGYSPNTAYPETFYGSGGQSGHDEGDFNR